VLDAAAVAEAVGEGADAPALALGAGGSGASAPEANQSQPHSANDNRRIGARRIAVAMYHNAPGRKRIPRSQDLNAAASAW
jgi:hypothetical protein